MGGDMGNGWGVPGAPATLRVGWGDQGFLGLRGGVRLQEPPHLVSQAGWGHSWGPSARQSPGKVLPYPDTITGGGLQGAQLSGNAPGFRGQARSVKALACHSWSAVSSCPFC